VTAVSRRLNRSIIGSSPMAATRCAEGRLYAQRIRKEEAAYAAKNAEYRIVAAVHEASGEVAGITELFISAGRPDHAHQMDTAVLGGHRGHGLGRAVKAAMMRNLVRDHPGLALVATQTPVDNVHMARVNRQIGYTDQWTMLDVQASLEELERRFLDSAT
jgi:hypothetical protein